MKQQTTIKKHKWTVPIILFILVFFVLAVHQIAFEQAIDDFSATHNIQLKKVSNKNKNIYNKTFKTYEKIKPLYFSFLAQPQAIKQIFKLSTENIALYHYAPDVQSALALKYLHTIKNARIQNQKWVDGYEKHLKAIKVRHNIDFNILTDDNSAQGLSAFIQELNTLTTPAQLEPFIDRFFTQQTSEKNLSVMVSILGKRYKGYIKTTDVLAKFDSEFEKLQSDFLIEAHKNNNDNLWKRFTENIQSFFSKALPITEDTMDTDMIDKINNDI
ncbi:MAG: hypothetical protein COY39_05405 [Alphaproteobacteria bacterium CG_4_10_14_0_8_um_filter_37_21]|nr:MAG: hypothetical protein COY39_05405 [Alphaproteobacteria bacterium CG_4_10_14_0_8_um_filter_37_21]